MAEEETNHSTDMDQQSSSSRRDSNPCPICLSSFLQESYLDTCFHKFCYTCIVQWTKIAAGKQHSRPTSVKCPLCKTENFSIIFGYDGSSYERHYINQDVQDCSFFTKAHKYRLQCYYTKPGILENSFNSARYWKSRKYLQPNRWLQTWLKREIQALIQEEDVDIIAHHILGVVESFFRRNDRIHQAKNPERMQEEFKDVVCNAATPFLSARTGRFLNELELFLASGLNIVAYDEVYLQHLGWSTLTVIGHPPPAAAAECSEHSPPVVPYLYILDEDCNATD